MNARQRLLLAALLLVGALAALTAVRLTGRVPGARAEIGRFKSEELEPATRARLATLDDTLLCTLYISARDELPSEMRRLERDVTALLEALRREAPGRVEWQVVDPGDDPDLQSYAGRRGVQPTRLRSVERDGYTEKTVWCSLSLAWGGHEPVLIDGLRPERLPRLQSLIVAHLDLMERPRQPVVALATSGAASCERLAEFLGQRAEVLRVDLDGGAPLPLAADLLFWVDPAPAGASRLRELESFLASGRSVVVADSELRLAALRPAADRVPLAEIRSEPGGLHELLAGFGVAPSSGLLGDVRAQEVSLGEQLVSVPFQLRCLAPQQDFQRLSGQPNGTLLFDCPTPLRLDVEALRARAFSAEILASSSSESWVQPAPQAPLPLASVAARFGQPAPRQSLMLHLRPDDAWQGSVVACAAATPFVDGSFERPEAAHAALVQVLLDTLASEERLVLARVGLAEAAALPELSPAERAQWRAFCVLLLPAALLLLAWRRGALGGRFGGAPSGAQPQAARRSRASLLGRAALGAAVILALLAAARLLAWRQDLTQEQLNELAPRTRELAAAATGELAVRAELFLSDPARLPPVLRSGHARLLDALRELRRAGAELEVVVVRPDELDADERAALEASGVVPVQVRSGDGETTVVRRVDSTLRLSAAGRQRVLAFPDGPSFEALEFRLAFALFQLQTGRQPHVGVAADAPRLSPAEARRFFQRQGLMSPGGSDVYALAKQSLENADYRVTAIDVAAPSLPADLDVLVWLQPRRPTEPMLDLLARFLRAGGSALVAVQHYSMQSRQNEQDNYEVVHWPQPQYADIDESWLAGFGVRLEREVLFDKLSAAIATESQVISSEEQRDFRPIEAAVPFVVRAVASNFADSPVTAQLGDQVLPSPARITLDETRLAEAGLRAWPLILSSERTWSTSWGGGWLSADTLAGPPRDASDQPQWLGPQALAVQIEGRFPGTARLPGDQPGLPGRLLLVGCSEMFKNPRLADAEFRADHLLLNAVASLALDDGLAAVASKRPVARGFDLDDPGERLFWRSAVLGGFPLLIALGGVAWLSWRRLHRPALRATRPAA